ncbi:MAG: propanediol utilization protein, partial [Verrucomicrobiaceae bacterium]|nr:propanediol utilization protein [Verrucomicrobiaceae bacterium]
ISGKPSVALLADKEYAVRFTVSNLKGSSSADASLLVKALPYGTTGAFTGPISRELVLNKNLGGRLNLTVASSGSYTASVTLGITAYSVISVLETDVNGANKPHGSFIIKRAAPAPPLTVTFDLDRPNHALINGDITDLILHAAFNGWRNKWGTVMPLAELYDLKTYLGYYTFALDIPAGQQGVESIPQGMGYGSFTVASTGALAVAGKLADGTAYTCSTFCGPHGEVLLYQAQYTSLGSVVGTLDIIQGADGSYVPLYGDNTLSGTVSWLRPATATHVYKAGFGPLDITAGGGRYVVPVAPALLFGVVDDGATFNAHLVFTEGGISGTSTDPVGTQTSPNINVRIKSGGLVFVPAHSTTMVPDPNPRSTTLAITQSTGFFTGHATLVDPNPAVPGGNITRTPYYYGLIIRDGSAMRGYGYFLLPRRPNLATETVLTTDQLSGQVVLERMP